MGFILFKKMIFIFRAPNIKYPGISFKLMRIDKNYTIECNWILNVYLECLNMLIGHCALTIEVPK